MEEEGLSPDGLRRLVNAAIDPQNSFRRTFCRRLAKQVFNQFGQEGLLDLLTGIDIAGKFVSVVVADKSEIEDYLFKEHGVYDEDMFERIQMTDDWDEFMSDTLERAGVVLGKIIDDIMREN